MALRMRLTSSRSLLVTLACVQAAPLLFAACKQPAPAVVDAGPPPAPTPVQTAPTQLVPLDETDAALAIDAAPLATHHAGGPALSANQARAKQCCNALRAQGKTDPMIMSIAAQCDTVASQLGPTSAGQAPEFGVIRQMLKGKTIPAMCSGL
jgi:hypothetical protein